MKRLMLVVMWSLASCTVLKGEPGPAGEAGPAGPSGAPGPQGAPGPSAAGVSVTTIALGDANCPFGGVRVQVDGGGTGFACNGPPGPPVVMAPVLAGDATCPNGGVRLSAGAGAYSVCNAPTGAQGEPGPPGAPGPRGPPGPGTVVSVTAGSGLTGGTITTSGTLDVDPAVVATLNDAQTFVGTKTVKSRLQVNTNAETTFDTTLSKYVLRTTFGRLPGSSIPVPQSVVDSYCSDIDGCNVTLSQRFGSPIESEKYARGPYKFYLDATTRRWRMSNTDVVGTDGNGVVEHILQVGFCFFTDGAYGGNYTTTETPGLNLLVYLPGSSNVAAECELIFED